MARPNSIAERLGRFAQALELARARQPRERLRLDLAHALGGQAEPAAGLAQRGRVVAVDAVAQPDHLLLLVGELRDRAPERLLAQRDLDLLLGLRAVAREQVSEAGLLLAADRLVEARDRARGVAQLADLVQRQLSRLRDLLVGRVAAEPGGQLALGARDLALALADMDRQPDRPALVGEAALDRLRELGLLLGREQRVAAHLVEEQLECVGGRGGQLAVRVPRGLARLLAAVVGDRKAAALDAV